MNRNQNQIQMQSKTEHHIFTKCGRRKSNEDCESMKINLTARGQQIDPNLAPIDFFIICDGHGGSAVSKFVVPELERTFMNRSFIYPLSDNTINTIYDNLQRTLRSNPNKIALHCGCTALVVIVYMDYGKKAVQVINIGDCRAVMSRNGLAMPLTIDHKPHWPEEKKRIEKVNFDYGTNKKIHYEEGAYRIGDLSVSRAFGDLDNTPHVTHRPDTFKYKIKSTDEFIILACDGVWDVLQSDEAVNFVRDQFYNNQTRFYNLAGAYPYPPTPAYQTTNIAEKLTDYVLAKGSTDNVSVIIIFFVSRI